MSEGQSIGDVLSGRADWYVHTGDNAEVVPSIPRDGVAVVSDVPYGMDANTDSTRFSGFGPSGLAHTRGLGRSDWGGIKGDDQPFDPAPWLAFDRVILWGSNHYAQRLPVGTTLVWVKRSPELYGTFLSDAEVAWMKGGHGVYCFEKQFPPPSRMAESGNGKVAHPTQKPIGLMEWCLDKCKPPAGSVIFDPYCGSGTTGVAALRKGFRFIGCEVSTEHADTARRRIRAAEPVLFTQPKPEQLTLGGEP
jgi:site-specific DNA-methyltransferase (adenine-specific)